MDFCGAGGRYPIDVRGDGGVVLIAPLLEDDMSLLQAVEDFLIETFITLLI